MVDLNALQRFRSAEQADEVLKEASGGYLALIGTHLFAAGWWSVDRTRAPTFLGNDNSLLMSVQLLAATICVVFWVALRKTGSPVLAWTLLIWSAVGMYHPATYHLYGFASKWPLMMMGLYAGILAVRATNARVRLSGASE